MEDKGLLRFVVKIIYPKNSLTKEDQILFGGFIHYLYFYGDAPDYQERMTQAWRPGAQAEVFSFSSKKSGEKKATLDKGVWI